MLIVRAQGDERIVAALRAELASYRFRVLELTPRGAARGEALEVLARARSAQAAVRAQPDKLAAELWVETSAASGQEVVAIAPGQRPELLATRATEAMRARGLRLPSPAPAVAPVTPARPTQAGSGPQPPAAGAGQPGEAEPGPAIPPPLPDGEAKLPVAGPPQSAEPEAKPPADADPTPAPAPQQPAEPLQPTAAAPLNPAAAPKLKPSEPPKHTAPPAPHVNPVPGARPRSPEPAATPPAAPSPRDTAAVSGSASSADSTDALLYAELSPAGVFSPGDPGLGPAFDVWANVRLQPDATTSLSLFALVPLLQEEVGDASASATVRTLALGGSADMHVPVQPFEVSVGLGAASLLTSVKPSSLDGAQYKGENVSLRTVAFLVRAGLSQQVASALRIAARVMIGVAVPLLEIRFDTDQDPMPVATWGQPFVTTTLGVELALPWRR